MINNLFYDFLSFLRIVFKIISIIFFVDIGMDLFIAIMLIEMGAIVIHFLRRA